MKKQETLSLFLTFFSRWVPLYPDPGLVAGVEIAGKGHEELGNAIIASKRL